MLDWVLLLKVYRSYVNAMLIGFVMLAALGAYFILKAPDFTKPGLYTLAEEEVGQINLLPSFKTNDKAPIIVIVPSAEAITCPNGEAIVRAVRQAVRPWEERQIVRVVETPASLTFDDRAAADAFQKFISVISLYARPTHQYFVADVAQTPGAVALDVKTFLTEIYPLSD